MRPNIFWNDCVTMKKLLEKENKNLEMFLKLKLLHRNGKCIEKQKFVIFAVGSLKNEPRIYRKVLDHDHVTGKIMGAAHSLCNLTRSGPYHTPIFFHNAQG